MLHELVKLFLATALVLVLQGFLSSESQAQDLEPRRWSNLPSDLNILGLATAWTDGEILFDPVLRIEDATFDTYITGVGYVRTFEFLGKSSRIDFNVPYAAGHWEGLVDGAQTSVRRRGFMDPRVRFSMNLYGAPPLKGKEYMQYLRAHPVDTTIGVAVQMQLPLGDYNDQKLINLGKNRFYIRPQLGVLHQHYKWQFELTGSVFLHQTNDGFFGGYELKQDPLWFLQGHAIYSFKPGWWTSVSCGYGYGGESAIDGVHKNDDQRSLYLAFSLGVPINKNQSLKLVYFTSDTNTSLGSNTNSLIAAWSMNWGNARP